MLVRATASAFRSRFFHSIGVWKGLGVEEALEAIAKRMEESYRHSAEQEAPKR